MARDASNGDVSIERNKVRHRIIPFLEQNLDKDLVEHIATICRHLRASFDGGSIYLPTQKREKRASSRSSE